MFNAASLSARVAAPARRAPARNATRSVTTATARVDKCDKKKVMVSPSILSANFAKLGEQVRGRGARPPPGAGAARRRGAARDGA